MLQKGSNTLLVVSTYRAQRLKSDLEPQTADPRPQTSDRRFTRKMKKDEVLRSEV